MNRPLRVNVLLSLREDTLARLDRLKGPIPNLFANVLRLDRLDRAAGRAAIVRPLERWGELEGEEVDAEDVLVERVLDGVGAGRIELGPGGLGAVEPNGAPRGIEAPYLQLVMQRLWDVERGVGFDDAARRDARRARRRRPDRRRSSRARDRGADARAAGDRGAALRPPRHAVGDEDRARGVRPRASSPGRPEAEIQPVIATLANHRILRTDESGRWEIFHDVLAGAVLGWKSRHDAERAVARAREESRRRHRRLGFLAFGALVGLALASALAVFAFSQRSEAREQARVARSGQLAASALSLVDSDPELGLALALEAARVDPNPRAEDALRQTLAASRERAIYRRRPSARVARARPIGDEALVVGRGRPRPADRPSRPDTSSGRIASTGQRPPSRPDGRTVHVVHRRSLVRLDAETGRPVGEPVRLVVPGSVERSSRAPTVASAIVIAGKPRARVVDAARTGP